AARQSATQARSTQASSSARFRPFTFSSCSLRARLFGAACSAVRARLGPPLRGRRSGSPVRRCRSVYSVHQISRFGLEMMSGEPARWPVRRVRSVGDAGLSRATLARDDSSGDTLIRDPNQVILGPFDVLRGCESFGWGIPKRKRRSYDSAMDDILFDLPPTEVSQTEPEVRGRPRVQRPRRNQVVLRPSALE